MTTYNAGDRILVKSGTGWSFEGAEGRIQRVMEDRSLISVRPDNRSLDYTLPYGDIEPVAVVEVVSSSRVVQDDPNEEFDVEDVWETGNEIEFTVRAESADDRWRVGCKRIFKSDADKFLIASLAGEYGSTLLTFRAIIAEQQTEVSCTCCSEEPYPVIKFPGGTIDQGELEEYSPKVRLISKPATARTGPTPPVPEPVEATFTVTLTRDHLDAATALAGACNSSGIESGLYALLRDAGGTTDTRVEHHDGSLVRAALRVRRVDNPF